MNEYTIYFSLLSLLLTSVFFQMFWSWCNAKQPKQTKENPNRVKKEIAELIKLHKEETKKLKNVHKETLKRKRKQLHESCKRRNKTIEFLKEQNYALQEKIREDKQTKSQMVLKVLEALKPLDG